MYIHTYEDFICNTRDSYFHGRSRCHAYSMTVVGNTSEYDITDNDVKATFDVSDFWEQDEE